MNDSPWALAIDFGTSRSAGAIFTGGTVTPLEVEGNRWISSAVLLHPDGTVLVGAAAEAAADVYPERSEPAPKHSLGAPAPLLLGGDALDPTDAVAAVLAVFLAEGRLRHGGTDPASVVLTHPVRWGDTRRAALAEAGRRGGLGTPWLAEEPVAAAVHYTTDTVPVDAHVAVYDLGGGTFDTAVLRRTESGFEVVGTPGGDETIGGDVFDHALYRWFGEQLAADDPALWEQMRHSDERRWKRAALDLLAQARRAKEALSAYTSTQVFVDVADRDLLVNRSQFEAMILDDVERTVDVVEDTVADAGIDADELTAIFLVGGSSRIPLVTQLLTERFGDRVTTRDEPKGVVALGAARIAGGGLAAATTRQTPTAATTTTQASSPPTPERVGDSETPVLDANLASERPARLAWRLQLAKLPGQIGTAGGLVAVSTQDGDLHAFDAATGNRRWAVHTGSWASAAPACDGEVVVVGLADGTVASFAAADGRALWRIPTTGPLYTTPLLSGGVVVAANDASSAVGLDRFSGATKWALPVGAAVRADPILAGPGVIVASVDGRILCIDPASGQPRWGYRTGGAVTATPALVPAGLLVPSEDGLLYALDPGAGAPLWAYGAGAPLRSPVAVDADTACFASADGLIHAITTATGEGLWRYPVGGDSSGPTVTDGVLVVDTGRGECHSVDIGRRSMRWRVATGAANTSRPVVCGGIILLATTFSQLYALFV